MTNHPLNRQNVVMLRGEDTQFQLAMHQPITPYGSLFDTSESTLIRKEELKSKIDWVKEGF